MAEFNCANCGRRVSITKAIGTRNRNHCPFCLWSKHVDVRIGDRRSSCNGKMEPAGLTFKKGGKRELMLVHKCLMCGKISFNRIAGDDSTEAILALCRPEDKREVETQLFGK